jgi:phosphoribosylamine--glycine ligase
MNVLLVGSGGREHALAYKIAESPKLTKLYSAPGNPGIEQMAELVDLNAGNKSDVVEFCKTNKIDLVVIGPEQPLVDGLADELRKYEILVFGPNKYAAMIEGDKSFAKELMKKHGIPTADFEVFTKNEKDKVLSYLDKIAYPTVIKASGLAAGKGVAICNSKEEAVKTIDEYFENDIFGESGHTIVIEEFLEGEEASVFVVTDGMHYVVLPPSQDHKRALDGDKGKNTGGMGAYAPAPLITDALMLDIKESIISPTLEAMAEEDRLYSGCLYCGLMITEDGPKVIEYNCRFGDPETQCVLPLLEGDFIQLLYSSAAGKIDKTAVKYNCGSSVCVVAASKGYPDKYEKGFEITGLDLKSDNVIIYHAGTKKVDDKIVTNGGRVLDITSVLKENDLSLAKQTAYDALSQINFEGITYRTDIADRALKNG